MSTPNFFLEPPLPMFSWFSNCSHKASFLYQTEEGWLPVLELENAGDIWAQLCSHSPPWAAVSQPAAG